MTDVNNNLCAFLNKIQHDLFNVSAQFESSDGIEEYCSSAKEMNVACNSVIKQLDSHVCPVRQSRIMLANLRDQLFTLHKQWTGKETTHEEDCQSLRRLIENVEQFLKDQYIKADAAEPEYSGVDSRLDNIVDQLNHVYDMLHDDYDDTDVVQGINDIRTNLRLFIIDYEYAQEIRESNDAADVEMGTNMTANELRYKQALEHIINELTDVSQFEELFRPDEMIAQIQDTLAPEHLRKSFNSWHNVKRVNGRTKVTYNRHDHAKPLTLEMINEQVIQLRNDVKRLSGNYDIVDDNLDMYDSQLDEQEATLQELRTELRKLQFDYVSHLGSQHPGYEPEDKPSRRRRQR